MADFRNIWIAEHTWVQEQIARAMRAAGFVGNTLDASRIRGVLPSGVGFSNPMTTKGDLIVGGASGAAARLAVGADDKVLTADSTAADGIRWSDASGGSVSQTVNVEFIIDGLGSNIATGIKGDLAFDFDATITGVKLLGDQSGNITVDLWKDSYTNFPPTVADTITASAVPALSAAAKYEDTTLTGWNTSISAGETLRFNVSGTPTVERVTVVLTLTRSVNVTTLNFVLDGNGSALTTGIKGDTLIDFDGTIQGVELLADQSGSIVIDLWKDSYANFPPTVADTITASAKPTLSSAVKSQDTTLTGWSTSISAGDVLRFNVDSASTVQRVTIALKISKT